MVQFKTMRGGTKGLFAGKSTHQVDGVGEWTGMGIVSSNFRNLRRSDEKAGWLQGQAASVRMLDYYKKQVEEGDESLKDRIPTTEAVIEGYGQFTGRNPLLEK